MREPYIYCVNGRHFEEIWREIEPGKGISYDPVAGFHAFFAVRVPFIPSCIAPDFNRQYLGSITGRIPLITKRQVRFTSDLLNARSLADNAVAFDLRFIATPSDKDRQTKIDIVYVGKAFHTNAVEAKKLCQHLWRKFDSHYPREDPFNYPIEIIEDETQFLRYFEPIQLKSPCQQLIELCKYEDIDPLSGHANGSTVIGYFPHEFTPVFDLAAYGRFIETLAQQREKCVVNIGIQPTRIFPQELREINIILANYDNLMRSTSQGSGGDSSMSWLNSYRNERFEDMKNAFGMLVNSRHNLAKIKIQVIGEREPPREILEAIGSELLENGSTSEPRRWQLVTPNDDTSAAMAQECFYAMEHVIWNYERSRLKLRRIPYLVSAKEATGAFRLPVPPEAGYLPGIEVKDEPFVLPHSDPEQNVETIILGEIIHRGQPSGRKYSIPIVDLNRHVVIAGATGAGKTNTCLTILSQLWREHRIPFLVIYPIDKPDYRLLMSDPAIRDDLLIFTVGDENTSPFRFNPFAVSEGILVRKHISLLMRCFKAAFGLWDPLPAVYGEALRQVYSQNGWDVVNGVGGQKNVRTPTMAEFYDMLVDAVDVLSKDYGKEVRGNIIGASQIRIRDLLSNIGSVINTHGEASFSKMLQRPTVMEVGRIGSTEDTALIMGFLLMHLAEERESDLRRSEQGSRKPLIHVTLVEEAHRLMSASSPSTGEGAGDPRAKGSEDFSNLLAEVRGFGEGLFIAEQIPVQLVQGAIGNTHLKIMHRLEDAPSYSLFCDILNLDERQKGYARKLKPGEVIVRDSSGTPIHLMVDDYRLCLKPEQMSDSTDSGTRQLMMKRFPVPNARQWMPPESPVSLESYLNFLDKDKLFDALNKDIKPTVSSIKNTGPLLLDLARNKQWSKIEEICITKIQEYGFLPDREIARGYFAYIASQKVRKATSESKANDTARNTSPELVQYYDLYSELREALRRFKI